MSSTYDRRASRDWGALRLSGDDRWRCRVCRAWKPVPPLARDCERRDAEALGVDLEELLERVGTP